MQCKRQGPGAFGGGGVEFHKQWFLPATGVIGGVAIALGVPWIVLVHGSQLNTAAQIVLIFLAVIGGGLITLASAFFGLVLPAKAWGGGGDPDMTSEQLQIMIKAAMEQKLHTSAADPRTSAPASDAQTSSSPNDQTPSA